MEFVIAYIAEGGGSVRIPFSVNPYCVLGVSSRATPEETKQAYRRQANLPYNLRQSRVMASLSYHMITTTSVQGSYLKRNGKYEIRHIDQFVLAATGYTEMLLEQVRGPYASLSQTDEHGRTSLYIAARSGFYDTTKALLEAGAPVDQKQKDGSTPLHGATFYGQVPVVKLLLLYGANSSIKNKWGNTPIDETSDSKVKQVILDYKGDRIAEATKSFIANQIAAKVVSIEYKEKEIARKIVRNYQATLSLSKRGWEKYLNKWETSWHGTRFEYLSSILIHGLLPSGETINGHMITPLNGHYELGESFFNEPNWAAAIFVSPDLLYASCATYAERLMSGGHEWRVLVRARVKPHSYSQHSPTALYEGGLKGEPKDPEFRIQCSNDEKIQRVESSRSVIVTSVVFIRTSFLKEITQSGELTYSSLQNLFGDE